MCCQTQSTIIPLAEKHSLFSLMQFTHCHFTDMMSQAGDASSPLFHALLLSRDDVGCSRLLQAVPPAGHCHREELHGAACGKVSPGPC